MTDAAARKPNADTEAGSDTPGLRVSVSDAAVEGRAPALDEDGGAATLDEEGRVVTLRPAARRRLFNLLLAKAAVDLIFVCALAAGFYYAAFRPSFRGSLDHADAQSVRGWVVDKRDPGRRVEVQLYVDGRLAAAGEADAPRPDVAAEGYAEDERHGFVFPLEALPPGEHEARVYAVHASAAGSRRTLQQIGRATRFVVKDER
jgi:hypothetical protein